ncbi:MAG: hypothetical protein K2X38_07455 [Gemmataceae bacterium]|nr:hypothetical protein [Gemmataceae bacterium]
MSLPPAAEPNDARKPKSSLLGFFVVLQIGFLAVSNGIGWLQDVREEMNPAVKDAVKKVASDWPSKEGPLWETTHAAHDLTRRYAEVTGQFQTWCLFAPSIGRECVFLSLELNFADGRKQVRLRSDNEPPNPTSYLRVGNFRLRRIENNLTLTLREWEGETDEDKKKRWASKIKEFIDEYERILAAYLRWRVNAWQVEHPGEPNPATITLMMRRYHVNDVDHERYWEGPFEVPVGVFGLESGAFIERYDPVVGRLTKAAP